MSRECPCCADATHLGHIRVDPVEQCSACGYYDDDSGEWECRECGLFMSTEPAQWHALYFRHSAHGRNHSGVISDSRDNEESR